MLEKYKQDLIKFLSDVESKRGKTDNLFENESKHINFYHSHSKQELLAFITEYVKKQSVKNDYDFIYMMRSMIKYMGNGRDLGTTIDFATNNMMPMRMKIVEGNLCIDAKGSEYDKMRIFDINGVDIKQIMREIENCISYGTVGGRESRIEKFLLNIDNILSLPSMRNSNKLNIKTLNGNLEIENRPHQLPPIEYDKYKIDGKTLIFKYAFCKKECAPDIQTIDKIVKVHNTENFVLDLRGNNGGNAALMLPLIKYLKQNNFNLTTLVDKHVASSGHLALMDMKRMGSKIIGEDIGTPINYFGYYYSNGTLPNSNFKYTLSRAYLYHDKEKFRMNGIFTKEELERKKANIFEPEYLKLDKEIIQTMEDFETNKDPVLEYLKFEEKSYVR